ncbi:MAG: hypothetical protein Kow0032_01910 [Methyloligellaceae bacterium]|nr:MAG: hypothetical protein D6773_18430 [Alphaproteobacteria bacterium]
MPQLIGLLILGAAAWFGYRWVRKEMMRVKAELDAADQALRRQEAKRTTRLEQDPDTGVYRPSDEQE